MAGRAGVLFAWLISDALQEPTLFNTRSYVSEMYRSVVESGRAKGGSLLLYNISSLTCLPTTSTLCSVNWKSGEIVEWALQKVVKGRISMLRRCRAHFYGRLFPPRSLHVAIYVLALQWMSQVPDAVVDRASPAYNRGRVWIDRNKNTAMLEAYAETAMLEAYAEAARQDLRNFLLARAEDVVSGGLVLFYATGRRADESHPELQWVEVAEYAGPFSVVFESTWEELVVEGIIDEERRDSSNVPFYCHSVDDVRAVVDSTNAYHIKRLETKRQNLFPQNEVEQILAAPEQYGQFFRNFTRALMNSFVVEHIGEKSTTEFFDRLERKRSRCCSGEANVKPAFGLCTGHSNPKIA